MEPTRIGRYVLGERIGQGGLARVYKARDTKLDRWVALKLLATDIDDADIKRRFQLEAKATANLEHPAIVRTFDYSDDDSDALFMVMEYIEGPNLHQWVDRHGPMSEQMALCIAAELTDALSFAHDRSIVHRDIKPSNVMLDDGRVVLVDFGGIKITGPADEADETRPIGTPGFMAPEQFEGRAVGPRTDVFAVGALLYFLTTGHMPYHGQGEHESYHEAKKGRFRDPRDHQPLLTPAFCYLLGDCLAVKPEHRPATADELKGQIERLLGAHGIEDVREALRRFIADPSGARLALEEQTVATLMRDLKLALFRELQLSKSERRSELNARVVQQLQQLAAMEHPPEPNEETRASVEVLQAGRAPRRTGWWVLAGFVAGAAAVVLAMGWLLDGVTVAELVRERWSIAADARVPTADALVDVPALEPPVAAPAEQEVAACAPTTTGEGEATGAEPCAEP